MATTSMTNALFTVMDRRGNGTVTRSDFNEMAVRAVQNNALTNPASAYAPPFPNPAALAPTFGPQALAQPTFGPQAVAQPAPMTAAMPASLGPVPPRSVTFGGYTYQAQPPTPTSALQQPAPTFFPASSSWAAAPAPAAPAPAFGAAAAAAPPPIPTQSTFLAAPDLPGVTREVPTQSMTNALFTAMDRRGDGIVTRDEWNQMAVTAVQNNPLVRPQKSLSQTQSTLNQSFASPPSFPAVQNRQSFAGSLDASMSVCGLQQRPSVPTLQQTVPALQRQSFAGAAGPWC